MPTAIIKHNFLSGWGVAPTPPTGGGVAGAKRVVHVARLPKLPLELTELLIDYLKAKLGE